MSPPGQATGRHRGAPPEGAPVGPAGLHIRPLQAPDLDALLALMPHLHAADALPPPRAALESIWAQMLQQTGLLQVYGGHVAGADGPALVASCVLVTVPNLTRGGQPYGLIENVVTHAAHRGRGHGQALLAHALAQAWRSGCYKVMLMTGRQDEAVFRFYGRAGFDRHGKQAFIARPPT